MSSLARAIYEILRKRIRLADPRISYKDLAAELRDFSEEFENFHHRNRQFFAALWEVGRECRRLKLPPLPALVVRADSKSPGEGYSGSKSSAGRLRGEHLEAWRRDLQAVKATKYPALPKREQARRASTGV